ncbi:MAG: hypothetical protein HKN07_10625 [Acidimicrobiia bacterium]|nr:hypothetical protein [Acidimicrobiia bacterium]
MLDELVVSNLGVLPHAQLEPGPGLVVVTGETGTGKTLLLGALRMLRGEAVRQDHVGGAGDEAKAEGRFLVDGQELTATRRIVGGRSRAYLDGLMASAEALAERVGPLIEVVAQHEQLSLSNAAAVRRLVDSMLEDPAPLVEYREAFRVRADLYEQRELLGGDRRAVEREVEMTRFQADEIAAAGFVEGDDEELASDAKRLRNAEAITEAIVEATNRLEQADETLELAYADVVRVGRLLDDSQLEQTAGEVLDGLRTLDADLRRAAEGIESDSGRLTDVESRVALLGELKRKYGSTLAEVLEYGHTAAERAAELTRLLADAELIDEKIAAAEQVLAGAADRLSAARRVAGESLSAATVGHLRELGFQDPLMRVNLEPADATQHGADAISLWFASDASLRPGPVGKVASGGELSRIVLATRLAAGVADAPIIAFDEIDAGIGGATALAMGRKLAALAEGKQILCVTHLPQVAAFAETHFVVTRDGSTASVHEVDGEERLEELSRMLAGLPDSERGRSHAAELLTLASGA